MTVGIENICQSPFFFLQKVIVQPNDVWYESKGVQWNSKHRSELRPLPFVDVCLMYTITKQLDGGLCCCICCGLVWFYGISTIVGYLIPNPLYIYIYT